MNIYFFFSGHLIRVVAVFEAVKAVLVQEEAAVAAAVVSAVAVVEAAVEEEEVLEVVGEEEEVSAVAVEVGVVLEMEEVSHIDFAISI